MSSTDSPKELRNAAAEAWQHVLPADDGIVGEYAALTRSAINGHGLIVRVNDPNHADVIREVFRRLAAQLSHAVARGADFGAKVSGHLWIADGALVEREPLDAPIR